MELQTITYLVVGLTFALYIGIALWARAGSTSEFYVAGGGVGRKPSPRSALTICGGTAITTPPVRSRPSSRSRPDPGCRSSVDELEATGEVGSSVRQQAYELGGTLVALLMR